MGVDTFAFQMVNDDIVPMGATGTNFDKEQYCSKTSNAANNGIACSQNAVTHPNYFKTVLSGLK